MKAAFVIVLMLILIQPAPGQAAAPSVDEIWQLVQQQQAQIESLQEQLRSQERRLAEAAARLQAASNVAQTAESNQQQIAETQAMLESTVESMEVAMASNASSGSQIGGYGELHYNNTDSGSEMDFHRYVLFFNHTFNDEFSFYSELELEHSIAGDGQVGEIELEQAFVQWDYAQDHRARMGVFLIPMGMLNETHEPETFYGVERNTIERNIIPATWWEGGIAFNGEVAPGWGYDFAIHSGLNLKTGSAASPSSASRATSLRSGRQKVGEANADSLAYTGRLSYSGIPGLQVRGAFQHQTDITQGDDDNFGIDAISANLFEANLSYQRDRFGLRALYALWQIDDNIQRLNPGADEQSGWYIEPSYKFTPQLGVFARYGGYDLTAGTAAASNERRQLDLGLNYWLYDNVVIKFDLQRQDNDKGAENDGFNVGVGYSF